MTRLPEEMRAIAIDRFEEDGDLDVRRMPVPEVDEDEVLVRVHTAGVGVWDPADRAGVLAGAFGVEPDFPYVLGIEGAGRIVAVGDRVTDFKEGDRAFVYDPTNYKARFYAEYAVARADHVARVPENLDLEEAGAMPADAITALCGLDEELGLREGESLVVFGASGGLGHMAVQLARRMGARVLAVASGDDGVELVRRLGADAAVDGHGGDVAGAAREFAPDGIDAALVTASGEGLDEALAALKPDGRIAHPNGVEPPSAPAGQEVRAYDGRADRETLDRLVRLIEAEPFTVNVDRTFPLSDASRALDSLDEHYLGKLALRVDGA